MRTAYLVTYDICDDARLRRVFRIMRGYGDHLQYSVFRCELTDMELIELKGRLSEAVHHWVDQVLFVQIGPVDGRGSTSITAVGRKYEQPLRGAIVV
jgi:CRISPR-associated protein Cas2